MTRLLQYAAVFSLSAALAACASPSEDAATSAEASGLSAVAEAQPAAMQVAQNAPLPVAIAPAAPGSPEDALIVPIAYACEGGRSFTAAFPADGKTVRIAAAGETRTLAHRAAADAVLFSDGEATLTADGAEATLSGLDGTYVRCMAG